MILQHLNNYEIQISTVNDKYLRKNLEQSVRHNGIQHTEQMGSNSKGVVLLTSAYCHRSVELSCFYFRKSREGTLMYFFSYSDCMLHRLPCIPRMKG